MRNPSCRIAASAHIVNTSLEGHNDINPGVKLYHSSLGAYTYVNYNSIIASSAIGRFSSIGPGCIIGLGDHPADTFVSTSPHLYKPGLLGADSDYDDNRPVVIGNDVWIGANVTVANGCRIGDGVIVAANSFVKGNIEPYSIVGGVPARFIRNRFTPVETEALMELKWWNKPISWIKANIRHFNDVSRFIGLNTSSHLSRQDS